MPKAKLDPRPKSKSATKKVVARKSFNVLQVTAKAWNLLWNQRKTFVWISVVYAALSIVFVQGFASGTLSGNAGNLRNGVGAFVSAIGSASAASNSTASAYQSFIVIIFSLAIIWTLRQAMANQVTSAIGALYNGMHPLVQFILILLTIGLQFLPSVIGGLLYSTVVSGGIAVNLYEQFFWLVIFIILTGLSLYMATSSIIALYIVTLPDITPIIALRKAKELVAGRRFFVLRKILFLPIVLAVVLAVIVLPLSLILPVVARVIMFLSTLFMLPVVHAYLYTLYRELVGE